MPEHPHQAGEAHHAEAHPDRLFGLHAEGVLEDRDRQDRASPAEEAEGESYDEGKKSCEGGHPLKIGAWDALGLRPRATGLGRGLDPRFLAPEARGPRPTVPDTARTPAPRPGPPGGARSDRWSR